MSVKSPHAAQNTHAATKAGEAASRAIYDKHKRYGNDVMCVAVETYERLAPESNGHLKELALLADVARLEIGGPRALATRWSLKAVVVFLLCVKQQTQHSRTRRWYSCCLHSCSCRVCRSVCSESALAQRSHQCM